MTGLFRNPGVGADKQGLWAAVRESGSHPHMIALLEIEPLTFHRSHRCFSYSFGINMERLAGTCGVLDGQQVLVGFSNL